LRIYRFAARRNERQHGHLLFSMSTIDLHIRLHVAAGAQCDQRRLRIVYHALHAKSPGRVEPALHSRSTRHAIDVNTRCATAISLSRSMMLATCASPIAAALSLHRLGAIFIVSEVL
jgi:hypothetical protein